MATPTVPRVCQYSGCGKDFLALVKQRKRKYCSMECAWAAKVGKAKPFRLGPSPYEPRVCSNPPCGGSFVPQIPEQIYCSKSCLKRHGRVKDYGRECSNCRRRDNVWRSADGGHRCGACNQYWKIHGEDRPKVRILRYAAKRGGLKLCFRCMEAKPHSEFGRRRRADGPTGIFRPYCYGCQRAKLREWHHAHPEKTRFWSRRWAASDKGKAARRRSSQRWRARLRAAFVEDIDSREIYDRDRWICQLCKKRVGKKKKHPDPGSASLDHKIPLARGGMHERANVQLAHLRCNSAKRDCYMPQGEQLLLFG